MNLCFVRVLVQYLHCMPVHNKAMDTTFIVCCLGDGYIVSVKWFPVIKIVEVFTLSEHIVLR